MNVQFKKITIFIIWLIFCNMLLFSNHFVFDKKIEIDEIAVFSKIKVHKSKIFAKSQFSIFILDQTGKVIKKIGQKGKGPGDFELLVDFSINNDKIFAVDTNGKIIIYDVNGNFIEETNTGEKLIQGICKLEKDVLLKYKKWVVNKKNKTAFQLIKYSNKKSELFSVKDNSKINAYHPKAKGKFMFPWFPNPFFNRDIFIKLNKEKIGFFFTKKKYFYIYYNNILKKVFFKYNFDEKRLDNKDKDYFFNSCELNSHKKFHKKTKKSVVFPPKKELFFGVIKWDKSIALLLEDRFIIVSHEGKFLHEIYYPEDRKYKSLSDFYGYPKNIFVKEKNHLYILNEDNEIEVYLIKYLKT